jgi:hypothetical protein
MQSSGFGLISTSPVKAFIRPWDRHSFGASQKSKTKRVPAHHIMGLSPKLEGRVRGLFSASQRPAASPHLPV